MLNFIWSIYIITVISLSVLVFLQKSEDTVSTSQSTFMTPRSMSTLLTKSTYFLYFLFISLSLAIGIIIKKEKHALKVEFESTSVIESSKSEYSDSANK